MTKRAVAIRSSFAILALAVATLATLAGIDALVWRGNDVNVRAQLALGVSTPRVEPATILPTSWSRALLGADDAVAFSRVLAHWQEISTQPFEGTRGAAAVGNAELQLERLSTSRALSARARSDALLLHSILLLEELGSQATASDQSSVIQRPLAEMRRAVTIDPTNVFAKHDVEVVLRIYPRSATAVPTPGELPVVGSPKGKRGGQGQGGTGDLGGGF